MRVLLVEGAEDQRVVPWLIERAGIPWGPKTAPVVKIHSYDGVESLLAPGEIETHLKTSGLTALGVMIDADANASSRWSSIRARIEGTYLMLPTSLPAGGVIARHQGLPAFGAWVMPDNSNRGMLETFLLLLRPESNQPLLEHCEKASAQAKAFGASFKDQHMDKARIHAWLAWQDPPGQQMHSAIMQNMLTNRSPEYDAFISWFKNLYSL